MTVLKNSKTILVDETEKKPNLYAARVLAGVVLVITIVCALNEFGVFELSKPLVRTCLFAVLFLYVAMQILVRQALLLINPATKYVMMSMVLLFVLTATVLLNIHAVLAFVLPLLLATQYRSHYISRMALIGSLLCCFIAPILSYLLDTWSLVFLTGYIQTFCHVTIDVSDASPMSIATAIGHITLYWSMPQMLVLGAFGVILYSATQAGIESVNNQIQVADLSQDLVEQLDSIQTMQERMLYSLSEIIENRDIDTGGHVRRTSEVVRILMRAMLDDPGSGVSESFCISVVKSAPMHDLGKIAVPDILLRKPGKLTDEEYELIKQHPIKSAEILEHALTGIEDEELLETAKNIALYHHERIDGTGYPQGLSGDEIPLEARIMAIADVYDALASERCYKTSMNTKEAFDLIVSSMGTQFDPALLPYFVACKQEIESFYEQ